MIPAGGVDEHIQSAVFGNAPGREFFDGFQIGQFQKADGRIGIGHRGGNLFSHRFGAFQISVRQYHRRPFGAESFGDVCAQPRCGACDDGPPAVNASTRSSCQSHFSAMGVKRWTLRQSFSLNIKTNWSLISLQERNVALQEIGTMSSLTKSVFRETTVFRKSQAFGGLRI